MGARVNGRLVPLKTPLASGDIVEILTAPNQTPSRDWLSFVATSRARHKIRQFIHTQENQEAVELGRRLLEKELKKYKRTLKKLEQQGEIARRLSRTGASPGPRTCSRRSATASSRRRTPSSASCRPRSSRVRKFPATPAVSRVVRKILPFGSPDIVVVGHNDLLASLAKCCTPVPGERIVGYITRGRGVSVHSESCPNVKNLLYDPERRIDVAWAGEKKTAYAIELEVVSDDRPGLLADLTQAIAGEGSNIRRIEARAEESSKRSVHRDLPRGART